MHIVTVRQTDDRITPIADDNDRLKTWGLCGFAAIELIRWRWVISFTFAFVSALAEWMTSHLSAWRRCRLYILCLYRNSPRIKMNCPNCNRRHAADVTHVLQTYDNGRKWQPALHDKMYSFFIRSAEFRNVFTIGWRVVSWQLHSISHNQKRTMA